MIGDRFVVGPRSGLYTGRTVELVDVEQLEVELEPGEFVTRQIAVVVAVDDPNRIQRRYTLDSLNPAPAR